MNWIEYKSTAAKFKASDYRRGLIIVIIITHLIEWRIFHICADVQQGSIMRWQLVDLELSTLNLKFSDGIKHLSIHLTSGSKFSCSYEHLNCISFDALMLCKEGASVGTLSLSVLNTNHSSCHHIIRLRSYRHPQVCSCNVRQLGD